MRRPRGKLAVWMNGEFVGTWTSAGTKCALEYDPKWLAHPNARPISLSLPMGVGPLTGRRVDDWFENLLPDSVSIRSRLMSRFRVATKSPMDLLAAIGRDCVGAIQLLPLDAVPAEPETIQGEALDESQLAMHLRNVTSGRSLNLADEPFRISIAGAQEKTALLFHHEQWISPEGSTPTNRILKLPLGQVGNMGADFATSVENEWLCSKIAAAFGLPVATCDIVRFEDQKALCVHRFDRAYASDGRWIMRLPQEDFCQALGVPSSRKYQSDGGPGIGQIMDILGGSGNAELDRENFFCAQILFWLLMAPDGHAKNFSIFIRPRGEFVMTPLYDILSAHPIIGSGVRQLSEQKAKLAMAVRGKTNHYSMCKILPRHWIEQGKTVGFSEATTMRILTDMASKTDAAVSDVEKLLPSEFPVSVSEPILDGLRSQAQKLLKFDP